MLYRPHKQIYSYYVYVADSLLFSFDIISAIQDKQQPHFHAGSYTTTV